MKLDDVKLKEYSVLPTRPYVPISPLTCERAVIYRDKDNRPTIVIGPEGEVIGFKDIDTLSRQVKREGITGITEVFTNNIIGPGKLAVGGRQIGSGEARSVDQIARALKGTIGKLSHPEIRATRRASAKQLKRLADTMLDIDRA